MSLVLSLQAESSKVYFLVMINVCEMTGIAPQMCSKTK